MKLPTPCPWTRRVGYLAGMRFFSQEALAARVNRF
jgi:hypothetical protein